MQPDFHHGLFSHQARVVASAFANIGARFPGSLPPQPWATELLKKRKEGNSKDTLTLKRRSGSFATTAA